VVVLLVQFVVLRKRQAGLEGGLAAFLVVQGLFEDAFGLLEEGPYALGKAERGLGRLLGAQVLAGRGQLLDEPAPALSVFAGEAEKGVQGRAHLGGFHGVLLARGVGGLGEASDAQGGRGPADHDLQQGDLMDEMGVRRRGHGDWLVLFPGVLVLGCGGLFPLGYVPRVACFVVLEDGVVFGLFVDAVGAFAEGDVEEVVLGEGARVPHGAMLAADLEAAGVEAVQPGVVVAVGRARQVMPAVVGAASAGMGRRPGTGGAVAVHGAADAATELALRVVDPLQPLQRQTPGRGGAQVRVP